MKYDSLDGPIHIMCTVIRECQWHNYCLSSHHSTGKKYKYKVSLYRGDQLQNCLNTQQQIILLIFNLLDWFSLILWNANYVRLRSAYCFRLEVL